jgi:uncharacterized membrane protein
VDKIVRYGQFIFAIAILALGVENIVNTWLGLFETKQYEGHLTLSVIPWVPAVTGLGYLMGLFLIAAALSFVANYQARTMALLLGTIFVLRMLFRVGSIFSERTVAFEQLAIAGAAFVLAGNLTREEHHLQPWAGAIEALTISGRYLFAASCVVFGIDHFEFLRFVANIIPFWIPWHIFWTSLTGAGFIATGLAFVAAGFGSAIRRLAKLAGFLLGVMFGLWFVLLHLPRVLGLLAVPGKIAPRDPNEWSSAFIALAMCGGSWICARAFAMETLSTAPSTVGRLREAAIVNR